MQAVMGVVARSDCCLGRQFRWKRQTQKVALVCGCYLAFERPSNLAS